MIFRAHGRFVETLKGRYITAEDVGTSVDDMEYVHMETEHVTGRAGTSGDPSPVTAYGVYRGIKAAAREKYGSDDLSGKTVTVQGVGHVGYYLCQNLASEGARLIVTDIDEERVRGWCTSSAPRRWGPTRSTAWRPTSTRPARSAPPSTTTRSRRSSRWTSSPVRPTTCCRGAPRRQLHERGILYAPDYVINAGGLINVYGELHGWTPERSMRKAGEIYTTLLRIFELPRARAWCASQRASSSPAARTTKPKARSWCGCHGSRPSTHHQRVSVRGLRR
jgi:leucine dehydrogenase